MIKFQGSKQELCIASNRDRLQEQNYSFWPMKGAKFFQTQSVS